MTIVKQSSQRLRRPAKPLTVRRPATPATARQAHLDDLPLLDLHEGQRRVLREARRFNVCALGRRFGKTELAKRLLCETAYVGGGRAAYCAPTNKAMNEFWTELKGLLAGHIASKSEQNHRLSLRTGGIIELWSMEYPERPRGRHYRRVVFDEAAQVTKLGLAWQQVMRPTLMDELGDCWWFSTPRGRDYFWQLYRKGADDNPYRGSEWQSWQMSSYTNPHIDPTEIDSLSEDLTERDLQQEIFAQFLEDEGAVFHRVREAAHAEWQERAIEGHQYIIGVDLARTDDWTVVTVIDTTLNELVYLDRFRQLEYATQRTRIIGAHERFHATHLVIEANAMGWPNIEELQGKGYPVIPFWTSPQSKKILIDSLIQAFELEQLAILPDEGLINELLAYESERLPSGLIRYGHPEGQHDDQVMSLALAWLAVKTYAGTRGAGVVFG